MRREIFSVPRTAVLCAVALMPLVVACSDGSGTSNDAKVQVQITDAPSDYIQSADIWVSQVYLQGGPGHAADTTDASSSGRVYLFNKPSTPFHADMMALRAGVVANLTDSVAVEPGSYNQLRIVVDSAKVTLKAGFTFEGGGVTTVLKIPSGSTSGIKVNLAKAVQSSEGAATILLVDFDVNQNFVIQGSLTAPFKGMTFTPVIQEKSRSSLQL